MLWTYVCENCKGGNILIICLYVDDLIFTCNNKEMFEEEIVGSLMYLTSTRPDIMYAVGMISRYIENSMGKHLNVSRRILR